MGIRRVLTAVAVVLQCSGVRAADKYLWAELIAFDNAKADFGVGEYLSRMPEKPKGVSLLLFDPDIDHSHAGLETDFPIGAMHCSYYARPCNEERARQDWTAWQLRGLVAELRKRNVEAYPSFFDMAPRRDDGWFVRFKAPRKEKTWVEAHPEVRYQLKNGVYTDNVCPIKRLADGTPYEDFFVRQLVRFLKDYGFAGFHAADGYGHPRYAICDADFSDDVLGQFAEAHPEVSVPKGSRDARAKWILANARAEWSRFHANRHAAYFAKMAKALHDEGLSLRANTSWTCDPHEALFRYGEDYRLMAKAGVDGFFSEASVTVLELEGWRFSDLSLIDRRRAALLRLAPSVPVPFIHLACVKDGMEQYNALRHAPALVEAEVLGLASVCNNGRRAMPDVFWCLADGITAAEWARLDLLWKTLPPVAKADGVRVVWSDRAADAELDAYCRDRYPSSYVLLSRLLHAGAVIGDAVRVADALKDESSPILVLNPECFPAGELAALRRRKARVVELGLGAEGCVFGERPMEEEPGSWLTPLPVRELSGEVFAKTAQTVNSLSAVRPDGEKMEDLRLVSYVAEDGSRVVVALNDRPSYLNAKISVAGAVESVTALTDDPSLPVLTIPREARDTLVPVKIPPSGAVALACRPFKTQTAK